MQRSPALFIAATFLLLFSCASSCGLCFFLPIAILQIRDFRLTSDSVAGQGTITAIHICSSGSGTPTPDASNPPVPLSVTVTVQYEDTKGKEHVNTTVNCLERSYAIGETIPIRYVSSDPDTVATQDEVDANKQNAPFFLAIWGVGGLIWLAFLIGPLIGAIALFRRARRSSAETMIPSGASVSTPSTIPSYQPMQQGVAFPTAPQASVFSLPVIGPTIATKRRSSPFVAMIGMLVVLIPFNAWLFWPVYLHIAGTSTQGVIINQLADSDGGTCSGTVRFTDSHGLVHQTSSHTCGSYPLGQTTTVYYLPANPDLIATDEDTGSLLLGGSVVTFFDLIFFFLVFRSVRQRILARQHAPNETISALQQIEAEQQHRE